MLFPALKERETDEVMCDPQAGDRFTEMCAFYVYVVHVDKDTVVTMEANPPCTFPDDGEVRIQTKEDFRKRFSYEHMPGYWVTLSDRGNNVTGWYVPETADTV